MENVVEDGVYVLAIKDGKQICFSLFSECLKQYRNLPEYAKKYHVLWELGSEK